ncbi:2Fe-2S iron-sulfur cluster binding domain-containing protein [Spongiibacter sp. KMU-158]|uniref:2Fe-2S iron-sulfur cluster binding domain-containing protein n=1 Tax=Spongiibacter pelagi TaxID=2760804 RepID=A0A927GXK0_9GAMM|nr:2Fe-2S iron-sulfur cluster-binding protein [Spongiibacter pelagi]MBD2859504.1 2Fe-2S iron-sulfur cluster binding domain-containing protein [Spongiibacter pelagi]
MLLINFITHDGNAYEAEVEPGTTVMEAAINNGIDAILGDCGGVCSCATCHCYVDEAWQSKTGEPNEVEKDMLTCVLEPQDNSRLGCQITITEEMNGLTIHLPASQY